jgi:hypothetical protein
MTEEELIRVLASLPGVVGETANQASGAPEVAWGDSFFFYDPGDNPDRRFPFATIVTKDYPGFDTASDLDRPGVFRLNLSVGRTCFEGLFGFRPRSSRRIRTNSTTAPRTGSCRIPSKASRAGSASSHPAMQRRIRCKT